jgi:hypothetical protein
MGMIFEEYIASKGEVRNAYKISIGSLKGGLKLI